MVSASRALIIDDEPVVQKLLVRILEREGTLTTVTASGTAALEALRAGRPFEAVFVDASIPPHGCVPILEALGALDPRPAIVLLSGRPIEPEQQLVLDRVGGSYLSKPFGPQALLNAARVAPGR